MGGIFVRNDRVRQLTDGGSEPVGGLLGKANQDVRDPSETWDGVTVTALNESRSRLMVTHPLTGGGVVASLHGGNLLPASIDGDGVVWAIDRSKRPPTIMRLTTSDEWRQVNVRGLNESVRAFRVSIDGTRVAVVVRTPDGGGQLLVGRVVRGVNGIRVEGFRPLALALRDLSNVSWITYDELLAVAGTKSSALRLTQVGLDGVQCRPPVQRLSLPARHTRSSPAARSVSMKARTHRSRSLRVARTRPTRAERRSVPRCPHLPFLQAFHSAQTATRS